MRKIRHSWNLTPSAAIALQHRLRSKVIRTGRSREVRHVVGTDVGFERGGGITRAAVAVLSFPGLELVDYAHPRRFGIACHMGVTCGIPSIGVAKSRLIGEHGQPMQRRGAWVPLKDQGETYRRRAAIQGARAAGLRLHRPPREPAARGTLCHGVHRPVPSCPRPPGGLIAWPPATSRQPTTSMADEKRPAKSESRQSNRVECA